MSTCKFVHYEVDPRDEHGQRGHGTQDAVKMKPAQWINCDVRKFDTAKVLGKFDVIMMASFFFFLVPFFVITDCSSKWTEHANNGLSTLLYCIVIIIISIFF